MIFLADENDENTRLDNFLTAVTADLARTKIQSLIKSGNIKVNGTIKKPSYCVKEGDKIEFCIPEEQSLKIEAENIPLEIIYEDENMAVINLSLIHISEPTRH